MTQHRYLPISAQDREEMLKACGVKSEEEFLKGIPENVRFDGDMQLGPSLSEFDIKRRIKQLSRGGRAKNGYLSFIGAGVYEHICPAAVNQLTLRGEFLTSYTPYQPELSQGNLQALFEYQTMVSEILGMEISNASHYDGSTATAEAALMALRVKRGRKKILVSQGVHPEYLEVMNTYLTNIDAQIQMIPIGADGTTSVEALDALISNDTAGVFIQSPNFFGAVEDQDVLSRKTKDQDALYIGVVTEPLSLGVFDPPGTYDADIAVGEAQSFGLPSSLGGPYVGMFTTKKKYVRQLPGRLCGETVDKQGRRSYTLTLSTREQHIRREKATSNICTNQNLCALWVTIWLTLVGKEGFVELAEQNMDKAAYLKEELLKSGLVKLRYHTAVNFNEFVVDIPSRAKDFFDRAVEKGIAPGIPLSRFFPEDHTGLLVSVTEMKSKQDIDALVSVFKDVL